MFHPDSKRKKGSRKARALILGAAAFALAGCREETIESRAFPSLAACEASVTEDGSWWTVEDCKKSFAEAEAAHLETAPRYTEESLCEEEHGGECVIEQRSDGSSVFLPLVAGYLIGNMLGGGSRSVASQPLYKTKAGGFATASGGTVLNGNSGSAKLSQNSFTPAKSTASAAPMTRATVKSTGGFGASRTSTSGSRSFGG